MAVNIETTEMHTGGEAVRLVINGYPPIHGSTILAKRRYAQEHLDHLRQLLMFEPRGHADMYGVILVEPDQPGADLGVLFMHNQGYSTMCGHAVIALGRWAIESGRVIPKKNAHGENRVVIQCPCGLVDASVANDGSVRFTSVPAFAFAHDATIDLPSFGATPLDIAYGGAFYAILPAARLGLDVRRSPIRDLVDAATEVSLAAKDRITLEHPDAAELAFLYGTILTDGGDAFSLEPTANVCVFAEREVDRSPTGSGVTARIALQHSKGLIALGQERRFESLTGAIFTGKPVQTTTIANRAAVIVEVGGKAHYSGRANFTLEDDDAIGRGFLLR